MAVSASATLCSVSDSSATDPDAAATTAWKTAVAPSAASEIHRARMPAWEASMAESTRSAASWLCGTTRWRSRDQPRAKEPAGWPCPCPWGRSECSCPCCAETLMTQLYVLMYAHDEREE